MNTKYEELRLKVEMQQIQHTSDCRALKEMPGNYFAEAMVKNSSELLTLYAQELQAYLTTLSYMKGQRVIFDDQIYTFFEHYNGNGVVIIPPFSTSKEYYSLEDIRPLPYNAL